MAFKGNVRVRMRRDWLETTEQVRPITDKDREKLHLGHVALSHLVVREISNREMTKLILEPDESK